MLNKSFKNKIVKFYEIKSRLFLLLSLIFTYIIYLYIAQYNGYVGVYVGVIFLMTLIWEFNKYPYRLLLRILSLIFIIPIPGIIISFETVIFSNLTKLYLSITTIINLLYLLITFMDVFNYIYSNINGTLTILKLKITNLRNTIKLTIIEYKMLILILFILIVFTVPVVPSLESDSTYPNRADANVSFYQYSDSNSTNIIVIPDDMNNSDYLIVKQKEEPSRTSTICKNKSQSDQIYVPDQSNESDVVKDNINSRYASILDSRCEYSMSIVKNLNNSDTVFVFGSIDGSTDLVASYKVK